MASPYLSFCASVRISAYGNGSRFFAEPVPPEAIQNVKQLILSLTPQFLKEPILEMEVTSKICAQPLVRFAKI